MNKNKSMRVVVTLYVVAIGMFLFAIFSGSIDDLSLEEYPRDRFSLTERSIQVFDTVSSKGIRAQYYELEFLTWYRKRYFLRSPHREDLLKIKYQIKPGDKLVLHYLEKPGKNGGHRIIDLNRDGQNIINFDNVVYEQKHRRWNVQTLSIVIFAAASLLLWFRKCC